MCIAEWQPNLRKFLREALSGFGLNILECVNTLELQAVLDKDAPDLIVLGLAEDGGAFGDVLETLAARGFSGKVLPLVRHASTVIDEVQAIAEGLGLSLLPPLVMPFNDERLRSRIAALLPEVSDGPTMDIREALRFGWLELWYQPKIDVRTLAMHGAEALLRIRHPKWGIVPPAYFIADDGDPRLELVSKTVISRAVDDWYFFFRERYAIELAINLPVPFFQAPCSLDYLCRKLPGHTAFEGILVESNGVDILRNLDFIRGLAKQFRAHKIGISIDDIGAEWGSFCGLREFPFVEIKVDRKFVDGCANDGLKRSICADIVKLANCYGARTVAEGVETWGDFHAVREMGFDLIQGFLFAKPMSAESLIQSPWMAPQTKPLGYRSIKRKRVAWTPRH
ncbi:hypothetical protein AUC70_04525 [Methyloceanibacter stevinii]|uniref:EAL domain-containing protein n=1 Tax=Methyloceanibacter stevinii TaxID=1774970 RepID=A0A1E3VNB0_9HYPH|nr:hypothetical protein AUC70_04525 [Methyloceanibacter stevinii]